MRSKRGKAQIVPELLDDLGPCRPLDSEPLGRSPTRIVGALVERNLDPDVSVGASPAAAARTQSIVHIANRDDPSGQGNGVARDGNLLATCGEDASGLSWVGTPAPK